jgi:MFS family permease
MTEVISPSSRSPQDDVDNELLSSSGYTTTVDDALEKAGYGKFQHLLMVLCGMCWAADGCEAVLLSFLIPTIQDKWNLADGVAGTLGATGFLGVFIGAQIWGVISDKYGRRVGYLACSLFTAVFGLISAFAQNMGQLIFLRLMVGVGLGGAPTAFTLFAEYVPASKRGKALVYNQAFWTAGLIVEVFVAWVSLNYSWRLFVALSSIPMWIIAGFFPILPESPRYYAVKGKLDLAEQALNKVALKNGVVIDPPVKLDASSSNSESLVEEGFSINHLKMLLKPGLKRLTLGIWALWFADAFVYYGIAFLIPRFFIGQNESTLNDSYVSILFSTMAEFPSIPIALFGMERFGRKKMLMFCFLMTGAFLPLAAILRSSYGWATVMLVIVRMHIATAYLVSYIYTTESYPTIMRATGLGVSSSIARVGGIVTSFVCNDLSIPAATFFVAFCSGITIITSWTLPKETTDAALDENPGKELEKAKSLEIR